MTGGSLISFASGLAAVPPDAAQLTGTVTIPEGGTGQTTAAAALTALGGVAATGGTLTTGTLSGTISLVTATLSGGATLSGAYTGGTFSGPTISGSGSIDAVTIGAVNPQAGTFTTLRATVTGKIAALVTVQAAPAAKTTSTTLTAAEVLGGIITANQGAAGAAVYTMPLGTALGTALPNFVNNDSFGFSLVNISANVAETATIATNTGITLVGGMTVISNSAAGVASSAPFLVRQTAANTFSVYRIG